MLQGLVVREPAPGEAPHYPPQRGLRQAHAAATSLYVQRRDIHSSGTSLRDIHSSATSQDVQRRDIHSSATSLLIVIYIELSY